MIVAVGEMGDETSVAGVVGVLSSLDLSMDKGDDMVREGVRGVTGVGPP